MTNKTGGSAFPIVIEHTGNPLEIGHGITVRDYFAAKAMQGLLASGKYMNRKDQYDYAADAYAIADAMLEAREE